MKSKPEYFISCDWGTSNFRLRLVNFSNLEILEEIKTDKGVKSLFEAFQAQDKFERQAFFLNYLYSQIELLPKEHQDHLIVSAGMISSRIGLLELDYAEMPFNGDGDKLVLKHVEITNKINLLIISGVKSTNGMMRGEEVQAIGLENELKEYDEAVLLLPGTHSKHLIYKNGYYVALKTFMTGELFEILSQKSILSNSIIKEDKDNISETSFLKGVKLGSEGKLAESLFSVRVNDIFGTTTKEDNYFFLSGLLLGDELAYLKTEKRKIVLAAPATLSNLYKTALDEILGSKNYVFLENTIVENAILVGQKKILESYE